MGQTHVTLATATGLVRVALLVHVAAGMAGLLTGFAAVFNAVRFHQIPSNAGIGLELKVIAAAVVAGLGAGLVDSVPTHREPAREPAATSSWPITVVRHHGSTKPGHVRVDQHLQDQP